MTMVLLTYSSVGYFHFHVLSYNYCTAVCVVACFLVYYRKYFAWTFFELMSVKNRSPITG